MSQEVSFWDEVKQTDWPELGKEMLCRLVLPFFKSTFVMYFVSVVGFVSTIGVWLALYLYHSGRAEVVDVWVAMATHMSALVATTIVDAVLDRRTTAVIRVLLLASSIILIVPFAFSLISNLGATVEVRPSVRSFVLWLLPGWGIWWIGNATNERFCRASRMDSAAGGNPMRRLG